MTDMDGVIVNFDTFAPSKVVCEKTKKLGFNLKRLGDINYRLS